MRKVMLTLLLFVVLAGWVWAAEQDLSNERGEPSVSESICPGTWTLSNLAGWVVRNENGLILPLSAASVVLGCDGRPTPLSAELSGASVSIECAPSGLVNGLADVLTVNVWCK